MRSEEEGDRLPPGTYTAHARAKAALVPLAATNREERDLDLALALGVGLVQPLTKDG